SLAIAWEIGDRKGEGISLRNLGNACHAQGNYAQAIKYHQQSLDLAQLIGDRNDEGSALGNLGNAYHSLGNYAQAIEYHQ
ncbi:MAG TPA: hypothetical protein DDZ80_09285, partial [Cyanobacteria bacterium UBA8803]|nr:hypothetical protein [Cyanobacteria bacterium UBA8803]